MQPEHQIGLVLSGGGPRGFAHFGVLKALEELNVKVDIIAGTSAGAVAGAFFASGKSGEDAFKLIRKYSVWRWASMWGKQPGILSFGRAQKLFAQYLPDRFEDLHIPLLIPATDIHAGESVVFSSGALVPAMCASSAIPVLFKPVEIDGRVFVDGGVLNNIPADLLRNRCHKIIAVNVNPILPTRNKIGRMQLVDRSIKLVIRRETEQKRPLWDIFIEPPACAHVNLLELKSAEKLFESGYETTMALKQDLAQLIHAQA
ncbi:MAG: patatin-like phospholipase family protein [Bacteroidetes bacterium]|nr:patatin-like phospholipase family protein [Bacteroidota bacterium]